MNTAALRFVIQTTQVRARDSGEASRTYADQAARNASDGASRGPALERFASAYVERVPDALDALLHQARAVAFEAPLARVLERALAGFAPAALAQAPSASLALLAAAYRFHRLLEGLHDRLAAWWGAACAPAAPSLGNLIAHQVLGQLTVAALEDAVDGWLDDLDASVEPRLTRQCFQPRQRRGALVNVPSALTRSRQRQRSVR
ncbi:hypothetical protein [Pseudomonas oryzihabitans]|uniref:hypothetical protein n=1 Tax=Pseudomonas oryzihabitans TaxID=47885 RepID=UPI00285DADE0|nr:hypothetical protein [Pseudomonas psychrotolerans]MDR6677093.1 hypothetical protein [Pseudomonas psychrotolerans]